MRKNDTVTMTNNVGTAVSSRRSISDANCGSLGLFGCLLRVLNLYYGHDYYKLHMNTPRLAILELDGTPYERGVAHGEALRTSIHEILGAMRDELSNTHDLPADDIIRDFLENTDFLPAIEQWTPGLFDEVRGIAAGSGANFDDLLTLNLQDEIWCYGFKTKAREWKGPYNKCTCAAAIGRHDSPTVSGQNMDVPYWHDTHQVLMRIRSHDSDVEALVFSSAGLLSLNGLNNKGVGVCVNALLELDHSHTGVPVAFVVRRALEMPDQEQAVSIIHNVPHASGQNYIISGFGQLASLECSANEVVPFAIEDQDTRTWHANEALANNNKQLFREITTDLPPDKFKPGFENSKTRMRTVAATLADPDTNIDVATLKQVFASREIPEFPISLHYNPDAGVMGFTTGCVIYEHRRENPPVLHLSPGPPDVTEFGTYDFSN